MAEDSANRARMTVLEVKASLKRQVSEVMARAIARALALQHLSNFTVDTAFNIAQGEPADTLESHAVRLRALASHSSHLIAELQSEAGHLEALSEFARLGELHPV